MEKRTSTGIKILHVDDDPSFSDIMAFWLKSKGHAVRSAGNGEEALEALEEELPHVVFLDLEMPIMNGIETLREIRKLYNDLPVIMVTAQDSGDWKEEAENQGISGLFNKTHDFVEAARLIEKVLTDFKKKGIGWEQDDGS